MIRAEAVRVRVVAVQGSAPRGPGAQMWVWADPSAPGVPWSGGLVRAGLWGTIGGGALEAEAMGLALGTSAAREITLPLGPGLGQCCGGAVRLAFEPGAAPAPKGGSPVWIWGAGHVGRALVATLAPLADLALCWIDTAPERFGGTIPEGVAQLIAKDPARLMARAPQTAQHYVLTYSHEIDLALCHAGLLRGFDGLGLIGSATKWARFRTRLRALGHQDAQINRITCPIGAPELGKEPQAIAIGVAQALIMSKRQGEGAKL